jgi:3-hydroxyacyl-[acyl-carrier-protein] dehydratase
MEISLKEIKEMIPHRYPFLLIDKVREAKAKESAIGIKNVTVNEPFFQGHFPEQPIMPGVLIIEAMAQTAGVLVVHTLGAGSKGKLVYFMTIDNCRFRKPVEPGDVLELHVKYERNVRSVWKFTCEAQVDGTKVAEATISAMITDKE